MDLHVQNHVGCKMEKATTCRVLKFSLPTIYQDKNIHIMRNDLVTMLELKMRHDKLLCPILFIRTMIQKQFYSKL